MDRSLAWLKLSELGLALSVGPFPTSGASLTVGGRLDDLASCWILLLASPGGKVFPAIELS